MVSFPAHDLDAVRQANAACADLRAWLRSPGGFLAFEKAFVLTGPAGAGKTHGVCDTADHPFAENLLTRMVFGHSFNCEPDPWTRLLESLKLPLDLGMDGLLDAMNAAAEA